MRFGDTVERFDGIGSRRTRHHGRRRHHRVRSGDRRRGHGARDRRGRRAADRRRRGRRGGRDPGDIRPGGLRRRRRGLARASGLRTRARGALRQRDQDGGARGARDARLAGGVRRPALVLVRSVRPPDPDGRRGGDRGDGGAWFDRGAVLLCVLPRRGWGVAGEREPRLAARRPPIPGADPSRGAAGSGGAGRPRSGSCGRSCGRCRCRERRCYPEPSDAARS